MSNRFWRGNRGNHYREGNFRGRGGRGAWGARGGRGRGWFGPQQNGQNFTNSGDGDGGIYQQQERNRFADYRSPKRTLTKRLSEPQIGVTEYINDNKGFNGIIKSRYSDFQVSELNMNGEVAKLTSLAAPELPKEKEIDEDEDLLLNKYNLELLPIETWDQINKLAIAQRLCTEKVQVDVTGMTKEQRTMIHNAVKKAFGRGIVGSTVTIDDKKYVCFEKFRKGVRIDRRVKWLWPGEYVYFIVHKENCDTMEAAARIAERLRLNLKPSLLGYAGTKDRRAKTSQWFSLRKVDPKKIEQACRDLNGIHVGNYSFADVNLRLGMLKGNKFRIVLRNVTADDELINEACELLQQRGFINYYGLQRFGTRIDTPTYEIGLKLFQGKLLEAINAILERRAGPLQRALEAYHSGGAAAAWRAAGRRAGACAELRLLRALAARPADLLGAIGKIPRNARLLYIHSYQSLVWNKAASERLRRFGLVPAAGDLVPLANVHIVEEVDVDDDSDNDEESTGQKADNEADNTETTDDKDSDKTKKKEKITEEGKEVPVKVLTQEDVDSGQYSIFDVVLPLPGSLVQYPLNMLQFYEDLLTADGLTLDMKNKRKCFSMSGAYRHLVVRPSDMQWRCVRYCDPYADLQLSDYDELCGNTNTGIVEDGKFKALLLTLTLPTSCYATMALRELLKVDTSCDNQALQNNYHQKKDVANSQDGDSAPVTETSEDGENQDGGEKRKMAESEAVDAKKAKQENQDGGEKRKMAESEAVDAKKAKQDD